MSEFESLIISVDFCSEPVTFSIAKKGVKLGLEFMHMSLTKLLCQLCPDRTQECLVDR